MSGHCREEATKVVPAKMGDYHSYCFKGMSSGDCGGGFLRG